MQHETSNAQSICSIHRTFPPLRQPRKADPIKDDYNNIWTQEEGKSVNDFHMQKQAQSTKREGTIT